MCASYVYKRRRLQNSVALLSVPKQAKLPYVLDSSNSNSASAFFPLKLLEDQLKDKNEPAKISLAGDAHVNHNPCSRIDLFVNENSNPNLSSKLEAVDISYKQRENTSEPYTDNHHNITSDNNYSVNDSCSSSRSHLEQYLTSEKVLSEDMGECSSSDAIVLDPPSQFSSSRDFCMHVLKTTSSRDHSKDFFTILSFNFVGGEDPNSCLPCKICGHEDSSKNMLICDLCDGAFHLHCCHEEGPFREEWYCQTCCSKKPRPLLDAAMGKSFIDISEEYKRRLLQKELGPIQFMLQDTKPYTSVVQIGKAFQADIPEWPTPTNEDHDSFGESLPLDPEESSRLNDLSIRKSSKLNSIGNWVQCREVICSNNNKHGSNVVCGKWRRAPLFLTQTDNWDCSCAVVWDPIHADCAVPQELDTEEVLKQLKFVEILRTRLNAKQVVGQTKDEDHR